MKHCMITFRSVTPAQRGERTLNRAGIYCNLSRTPRQMEEKGCGYCLRLYPMQLSAALQQLERDGIAYQKIYEMTQQGKWEEVR